MRKYIRNALLLLLPGCCTIHMKPDVGMIDTIILAEQVSRGRCVISFSPDILGYEGFVVELTLADSYLGTFLISYNDYLEVPCKTGDLVIFHIYDADGTFLKQKSELILPPKSLVKEQSGDGEKAAKHL